MRTVLKTLLWLAGLVVVLVALAAVVVPLYVDPNDFKGTIERQLESRLGRRVSIQGDIGLSVFPWLGLEVGRVTLGNPPGFAQEAFASLEGAEVRVKVLPLMRREIEADTVAVRGLDLRLVRDRAGRANWDGLLAPSRPKESTEPAAPQDSGPTVAALTVGGLDLRDTRIAWTDEATGRQASLEDLDLKTGAILPGQPISVDLSVRVRSAAPAVEAEIDLEGHVDAFPERAVYRMRDVDLEGRVQGPTLPAGGLDLTARGQLELDLAQKTVKAVPLVVSALGVEGELAVVVEDIMGQVRYSTSIDTREADLRALLERLGISPPETADRNALTRVTLGTRVSGSAGSATFRPLVLRIDDSRLEGHLEVLSFAGPSARFELQIDQLDLDRYLPPERASPPDPAATAEASPPSSGPVAGGPAAASVAVAGVPVELLRGLDLEGQVRVDGLKVANLRAIDVGLTLKGRGGVLTLDPAEATLYQGSYRGRSRLDVRGDEPRIALEEQLSRVQTEPLLKDLLGQGRLRGVADVTTRLELSGRDRAAMRQSLTGDGRFSVREGAIEGVDLARLIRQARAVFEGRPPPAEAGPAETAFTEIRGTVQIADGVARSEDLQGSSPLLRVEGTGTADLVREELDAQLTAHVVGAPQDPAGGDLTGLQGLAVPVAVNGPFEKLSYKVQLDEVLKDQATEDLRQKAEEAIDKKLGGETGEKAKALLRGLFR